ncbi:caspase family protein [Chitinophaga flava]|uniref:Peptidase C14 caspase domain-containing protein n=1 Tax=Chitinophaga flava TaxID=2259036 RepID=A0A365XSD4_9BACT|nr:caspase family protein [Chitinophaga flava]RBL89262.1 hypothetical protein DF182_22320 [Chitinophaga flava]
MKEKRYAILIGQDKYHDQPLKYSNKDVNDLRKTLISHCRFEEENIYTIDDTILPVAERIAHSIALVKNKVVANQDLFLFYYSGHGVFNDAEEESVLELVDQTTLSVKQIMNEYFEPLSAKNQYLIIDACHAGGNIYVKGNHSKIERKNYYDSKEIYLLFAAEADRKALQSDGFQNSIFTHFFIQAIHDEAHYDSNGFLTMSSIDTYIKRKASELKKYIQIPVSESRTRGYKPFSYLPVQQKIQTDIITQPLKNIEMQKKKTDMAEEAQSDDKFDLEESLKYENRKMLQTSLQGVFKNCISNFKSQYNDHTINALSISEAGINTSLEGHLEKAIIEGASNFGLMAIHDIFEKTLHEPQKRTPKGLASMVDILYGEPSPFYTYSINFHHEFIHSAVIKFESSSVYNVSASLVFLCYQVAFGFVLCSVKLLYSWDGTKEKINPDFISPSFTSYRLMESNIQTVEQDILHGMKNLQEIVIANNELRRKDIQKFLQRAK